MSDQPESIHMAVGQLLGTVQGVATRLEEMNQNFHEFRKEIREEQKTIKDRLAEVERFMWKSVGISAAAATLIPIAISVVMWVFDKV